MKQSLKAEEFHIAPPVTELYLKNKKVAVVGGGDSAVGEATFLTRFAQKVYLIHRRDELRATKAVQKKAKENNKIQFIYNSIVKNIKGSNKAESIVVENTKNNVKEELEVDGVFYLYW